MQADIVMASAFKMLGSIDANTGSPDLGWDTDQFPMDIRNCTAVMKVVLEKGGLAAGGLNFDAKVRRESTDLKDMFIAHLLLWTLWPEASNARITAGQSSLEECEKLIHEQGNPNPPSAHQEHFEGRSYLDVTCVIKDLLIKVIL